MTKPTDSLPKLQAVLYEAMGGLDRDQPILTLHRAAWPDVQATSVTRAQERLGPLVSRLNAKLAARGERIKPGLLKQTYRLVQTDLPSA